MNKLEISIDTGQLVSWKDIQPLQPDDLKINRNHEGIASSMKLHGFSRAFDVWRDPDGTVWSLDGVGRKETLENYFDGWEIPEMLPAIFHECKDRKDAISILTNVFSQKQAQVNEDVFGEWLEFEGIDIGSEMILPDMDFGVENVEGEKSDKTEGQTGDSISELKKSFEVVIECESEFEQEKVFNEMIKKQYKCRVLTL